MFSGGAYVDRNLIEAVLELGQDVRRCFFSVLPDEVRAWAVGLNQPAR